MLEIDKFSRVPIYEQIVAQMERHIRLGAFLQEEALPSVRTLALSLGVNPNTLQKAYAELERRGLCISVPGSGRFVSRNAQDLLLLRSREKADELLCLMRELIEAGMQQQELKALIDEAEKQAFGKDKI